MKPHILRAKQKKKSTIYDADLNFDRTKRIYKALHNLSENSVKCLKNGSLKEFSFSTDKMRPLMAYINDNSVLISKHLNGEEENACQSDIKGFASSLTQNIRTINKVQNTMNQVDFNPVFFLSGTAFRCIFRLPDPIIMGVSS